MKGKRCQDSGHLAIILSSWRPRQEHHKSMARLRYTRKPCFRKIWSSTGRSKVRGRRGRVHNFSGCRYLAKVFHLDWCWCPPTSEKLGEYVMHGVAAALLWLWGGESLGKSECVNNARVETTKPIRPMPSLTHSNMGYYTSESLCSCADWPSERGSRFSALTILGFLIGGCIFLEDGTHYSNWHKGAELAFVNHGFLEPSLPCSETPLIYYAFITWACGFLVSLHVTW